MSLNIIGISAFYHDSACCLLKDGDLVCAVQQERFSGIKNDKQIPVDAFKYCLKTGMIDITDIDCLSFYEDPEEKLSRQLWSYRNKGLGFDFIKVLDPHRPEREIRRTLGYEGAIQFQKHHMSHAASSYYYSGFSEAAILTVDGVGEWATSTLNIGSAKKIIKLEQVDYPNSLGLLYSTVTHFLGFEVNEGEYKVMGLAPYGNPIYRKELMSLVTIMENGHFALNMKYFDFTQDNRMFTDDLIDLFQHLPRLVGQPVTQFHKDLAKSVQVVLEELILSLCERLYSLTGVSNLCMAGGVALNCVANARVLREGRFKKLFIQPAANDSGAAIGAAALAHYQLDTRGIKIKELKSVFLGPSYSSEEVWEILENSPIIFNDFTKQPRELIDRVARLLEAGKVIGWFQGRMEFGPRALGGRSILADPRSPLMKDRINRIIKNRESFRPFAPAVLEEKCHEHFLMDQPSPFMLLTCQVSSTIELPAVVHVDNSARVQTVNKTHNPKFSALLKAFYELTGCPILLNTSFNVKNQPIVRSPVEAMLCFFQTELDALVMEDFMITKEDNLHLNMKEVLAGVTANGSNISHDVYTFV